MHAFIILMSDNEVKCYCCFYQRIVLYWSIQLHSCKCVSNAVAYLLYLRLRAKCNAKNQHTALVWKRFLRVSRRPRAAAAGWDVGGRFWRRFHLAPSLSQLSYKRRTLLPSYDPSNARLNDVARQTNLCIYRVASKMWHDCFVRLNFIKY